jgi:hypothetical protein
MITTEVYVSIDGSAFNILDLKKDESIIIKNSKKDLQDITKLFAPYSMNFNFPATPRNRLALGFFGNTEVLKVNTTNEFSCKIYTNGMLSQIGKLKLKSVKYKDNKALEFTASFTTTFLSLKDRLGEDNISDLSSSSAVVSWRANNVFNRLKSTANINVDGVNINYFVPLISNNRVWQYSNNLNAVDNVLFNTLNSPFQDKIINVGELRPVINVLSIINLIKQKYGLVINTPLEQENDLTKLYIWCNGSNFTLKNPNKFILTKQFSNESPTLHGTSVANFTDSSIKITVSSTVSFVQYRIILVDTLIGELLSTGSATISIVRKLDFFTVLAFDFEIKNGTNELNCEIPMYLFDDNEFEFFTFIKFDKPVYWNKSLSRVLYRNTSNDRVSTYLDNFNSDLTGSSNIDLIKSLPEMKVIDFLTSYLKTFNMAIYDSSPTDDNLFFLTPKDIDTSSLVYSKREVDYTPYADISDVEKEPNNPFNYYNFKHADSKYKSNSDFEKQFGVKYGQTFFPLVKPEKANEFKIETHFSIIPPVLLIGLQNTYTAYGFTDESPEIDDQGRFRYTPNLDEPTLFYYHGKELLEKNLACQNIATNGSLVMSSLNAYNKVLPFCKENLNTISFSILTIKSINYPATLFQNYYKAFIERLLNANALSQTFNLILPSSEIYLNQDSTVQGLGATPNGFRLQNEIIIQDTKYEILEAQIDITTGKTKLTLLNF